MKREVEELRGYQEGHRGSNNFTDNQLSGHIPLDLPPEKIQHAFALDKYSTAAPLDYDILMQDPFEIAKSTVADLLSAEDRELLQSLYFSNCHPFIPIIHEPSFEIKEREAHVALSIFALACRHDTNFSAKADIFYNLAKQTTQATFMNPDMSTLVALLLQAVFEIGRPNTSVHSVTTVGAALALASSFRLLRMDDEHADKRNQWLERPKNWIEEEGRRRVLLMVLSISRWSSTIQQRELGFPVKKEISVFLPVSDQVWFSAVRLPIFLLPQELIHVLRTWCSSVLHPHITEILPSDTNGPGPKESPPSTNVVSSARLHDLSKYLVFILRSMTLTRLILFEVIPIMRESYFVSTL